MALYEYLCRTCGYRFEELRGIGRKDVDSECDKCGSSEVHRLISLPAKHHIASDEAKNAEPIATMDNGVESQSPNHMISGSTFRGPVTAIYADDVGHLAVTDNRFIDSSIAVDATKTRLTVKRNTME
jgi:putative FmdB family regulatory protein